MEAVGVRVSVVRVGKYTIPFTYVVPYYSPMKYGRKESRFW